MASLSAGDWVRRLNEHQIMAGMGLAVKGE